MTNLIYPPKPVAFHVAIFLICSCVAVSHATAETYITSPPVTNYTANITNDSVLVLQAFQPLEVSGVISGAGRTIIEGGGVVTLSGLNTYTGLMDVFNGTLVATTIGNTGEASSVGAGGTIRFGGFAGVDPVLEYVGGEATSDKQFQMGGGGAANTGGAILNNGSGALVFNNATFNTPTGGNFANTVRELTLGGNHPGDNTIVGVIGDNIAGVNTWNARNDFYFDSTSYTVSPVEFGPWQGATTPAGASLAWGYYAANVNFFDGFPATIGSYFGPGNNTSSNQVLLAMANYQPLGPGQLQIAGGGVSGSADAYDPYAGAAPGFARYASVIVGPAVELGVYGSPWFPYAPQAASGAIWMQPVWLGGTTDEGEGIANVLTWTAPAAGTYTFSGSFVIGGTDPSASGASFAIVDSLGNIPLPRAVGNQTSTHFFDFTQELSAGDVLQFQVGSGFAPAAAVGLNVDVVLEDAGSPNNKVSVAKTGAGKWVLGGANIYTGDTTVSEGVLELGSGGSLRFVVGDSGVNNQLKGAGTLNLNGQLAFDLSGASTNTNSTWTVVSNSLSTTYGTNFLVTGFNGSGGNWTNTTNGVDYVFAQSTGVLSVQATGGVTPYNAWVTYWQGIDPGFTNTAGTANPDGDPFNNNAEFAFGGNPTIGTGALLTAVQVGTNAVFNYVALTNTNAATYVVQNTTNLATGPWTNAPVTISDSTNQSGILIPADYVRKEFTVPAAGKAFYRLRATTLP